MKEKKLLVIIPSLHIGGAESQLAAMLPLLQTCGWQITVFLSSANGPLVAPLAATGIKIKKASWLSDKLVHRPKIFRLPLLLLRFVHLSIYLLLAKPNVIQFILPEAYILGGLTCILSGQRNLIMNRRSLNKYQTKYPLLSKLEKYLHRKMQYIITNSNTNIQQLIELEQVPAQKLKLIYNGLDTSRFIFLKQDRELICKQLNIANSSLTLIVVANIIPYKGHAVLLQALGNIASQLPDDWQLLCVGKKYDYVNDLILLAQQAYIQQHVHWLGTTTNVEQFLAISDLAISCSLEEGFSNAVIEAMAAGLPVIVTDVGGNPEAVQNGVQGIVVAANDAQQLAAAILQLSSNQVQRQIMGQAAQKRVAQHFSLAACVEAYNNLFNECLGAQL